MDKLIVPWEHDELVKAAGQIATFFENFSGVKSASSNVFTEELMQKHVPDDDHFGVHLVAMGCGEDYGFNKNGDWWNRDMLVRRHNTFQKNGHFFREHNNRDPKLKIGDVVATAWNDKMGRVELIVHGNKRKAEPEYRRAKEGKQSSYSMSARVPYDICSCCRNKAKNSSVYCTHLKDHMTQWLPKFTKFAYAINEEGTFFDISDVANPADRTAHYLEYLFAPEDREMAKAASEGRGFLFSDLQAKLAGVKLPEEVLMGASTFERRKWLEKFAAVEEYIEQATDHPEKFSQGDLKYQFLKCAVAYGFDPMALNDQQLDSLRSIEPDILFFQMAKRGAVFPFLPFYAYITSQTIKQASENPVYLYAAERLLPKMFREALVKQADSEIENMFVSASLTKAASCAPPDPVQKVMDQVSKDFSIEPGVAKSRILHNSANMPDLAGRGVAAGGSATDAVVKQAKIYAQAYAMYKVAFAESSAELRGNSSIDEPSVLLITFPYRV
jgi:hypothetical protein